MQAALSFCAHDRDAQGGRTGVVAAAGAILQGDQRMRVERAAAIGANHHFVGLARGRRRLRCPNPEGCARCPRIALISLITFVALRPRRSGLAFLADISLFPLNFFGAAGQTDCTRQGNSHWQCAHGNSSGARDGVKCVRVLMPGSATSNLASKDGASSICLLMSTTAQLTRLIWRKKPKQGA